MKVGLIIMALTTLITMNACSKINKEIANDVCVALAEKYGESFAVTKIGDRFNTNSAKLYVYPTTNENVVFIAKINNKTGIVEDNYVEEKVNFQVEDILRESFEKNGIIVASRSMVITRDPLNVENDEYTPKNFSEKYGFDHYTIYLALRGGNYSAEEILNAIKTANEKIGVKLVIAAYVFDETNFSECATDLQEIPDMSLTLIEAKSPLLSFDVNVEHGSCSITESELSNKLRRS